MVESLPANAGDTGSSPGLGESPMPPARLEPVLRRRGGRDGGRPVHRGEEWPPLAATGGGPRTEARTLHSHK